MKPDPIKEAEEIVGLHTTVLVDSLAARLPDHIIAPTWGVSYDVDADETITIDIAITCKEQR